MPHAGGESERLRKQKCKNHRKNPCKVTQKPCYTEDQARPLHSRTPGILTRQQRRRGGRGSNPCHYPPFSDDISDEGALPRILERGLLGGDDNGVAGPCPDFGEDGYADGVG